ncbi:hypothetical protein BHM03_00032470 [Ensete ventricosum]|nr:hypothetical protein BHM03_00032470 [Ensete ventricosum]
MLQCANQYIAVEVLVTRKHEDHKRPHAEKSWGSLWRHREGRPIDRNHPTRGASRRTTATHRSEPGCKAGLVVKDPNGRLHERVLYFEFKATNNEAEYKALLFGICLASRLGAKELRVFSDSQLMVGHINKDYKARDLIIIKDLVELKLGPNFCQSDNLRHSCGKSFGFLPVISRHVPNELPDPFDEPPSELWRDPTTSSEPRPDAQA